MRAFKQTRLRCPGTGLWVRRDFPNALLAFLLVYQLSKSAHTLWLLFSLFPFSSLLLFQNRPTIIGTAFPRGDMILRVWDATVGHSPHSSHSHSVNEDVYFRMISEQSALAGEVLGECCLQNVVVQVAFCFDLQLVRHRVFRVMERCKCLTAGCHWSQ